MAAVIPNSFTRIDLWAMLLPGYVTLILGLLLFYPIALNIDKDATFNLFSAIVFLVAGPAIGFTLTQFTHIFVSSLWHHQRYNFIREYSRVRLNSEDNKNSEFDNIDARTTFSRSTGVGLVIIASLLILWQPSAYTSLHPLFNQEDNNFRIIIGIVIYFVGVLLIIGASLETIYVRDVLICSMINEKYKWIKKKDKCVNLCSKFENTDERRKHVRNTILTISIVAVGGVIAMVLVNVSTTDQYGQNHVGVNITGINGTTISTEGLISYLELNKSTPSSITLTVYRNGQTLNTTLNIK